jgi:ABC-type transporter Mla subunit MlaD
MIDPRDHLSERFSRHRLGLELRRSFRPAVMVIVGLTMGLLCTAYIGSHILRTLGKGTYEASFTVMDATGVVAGKDDVRMLGIPAGTITDAKRSGDNVVISVKIAKSFGHIYKDAQAELRPNTPLQDIYLDVVDRGSASAGAADPDVPLPLSQTDSSVRITDVLDVLKGSERARLASLLDNLGNGLADRGAALRGAFVELKPFLEAGKSLTDQLARHKELTAQLVSQTGDLLSTLATRQGQLRTLVDTTSATSSALERGDGDVDTILRQLPPTLTAIDSSFAAMRGVLGDVDGAVKALYPVADRLDTSLASLRELSDEARPAVDALQRPVQHLVPLANSLVPVARSLSTTAHSLLPQVGAINHTTNALARCKKGVQGFFQWDASMTKFGDTRGPVPRGNVAFGGSMNSTTGGPFEGPFPSCARGGPIGGRIPTPEDLH